MFSLFRSALEDDRKAVAERAQREANARSGVTRGLLSSVRDVTKLSVSLDSKELRVLTERDPAVQRLFSVLKRSLADGLVLNFEGSNERTTVHLWNYVCTACPAAKSVSRVLKMKDLKTDRGRSKAWVRCALMEGDVSEPFSQKHESLRKAFYTESSVLTNEESAGVVRSVLANLDVLRFSFSDSCLCNVTYDDVDSDPRQDPLNSLYKPKSMFARLSENLWGSSDSRTECVSLREWATTFDTDTYEVAIGVPKPLALLIESIDASLSHIEPHRPFSLTKELSLLKQMRDGAFEKLMDSELAFETLCIFLESLSSSLIPKRHKSACVELVRSVGSMDAKIRNLSLLLEVVREEEPFNVNVLERISRKVGDLSSAAAIEVACSRLGPLALGGDDNHELATDLFVLIVEEHEQVFKTTLDAHERLTKRTDDVLLELSQVVPSEELKLTEEDLIRLWKLTSPPSFAPKLVDEVYLHELCEEDPSWRAALKDDFSTNSFGWKLRGLSTDAPSHEFHKAESTRVDYERVCSFLEKHPKVFRKWQGAYNLGFVDPDSDGFLADRANKLRRSNVPVVLLLATLSASLNVSLRLRPPVKAVPTTTYRLVASSIKSASEALDDLFCVLCLVCYQMWKQKPSSDLNHLRLDALKAFVRLAQMGHCSVDSIAQAFSFMYGKELLFDESSETDDEVVEEEEETPSPVRPSPTVHTERPSTHEEDSYLPKLLPLVKGESEFVSVTLNDPAAIENALPSNYKGYDWRLMFSTEYDGENLDLLLERTSECAASLIVVRTVDEKLLGAFCPTRLKSSHDYYGTGETFLFTSHFSDDDRVLKFTWTRRNRLFVLCDDNLAFGGGKDGFGLYIDGDLKSGTCAECDTFSNDEQPKIAPSDNFDCRWVEAFSFVPK